MDAHLTELEPQDRDLLDRQRLAEGVDHRGAVGAGGSLVQAGLEDADGHVTAFSMGWNARRTTTSAERRLSERMLVASVDVDHDGADATAISTTLAAIPAHQKSLDMVHRSVQVRIPDSQILKRYSSVG
jgi:hypothetical protein